jgi:hypothetical protein
MGGNMIAPLFHIDYVCMFIQTGMFVFFATLSTTPAQRSEDDPCAAF